MPSTVTFLRRVMGHVGLTRERAAAPASEAPGREARGAAPAAETAPSSWDCLSECTLSDLLARCDELRSQAEIAPAVQLVMSLRPEDIFCGLLGGGERGLPSEPRFEKTGFSRMMVARYLVPGAVALRGREVLDACCGLGWGAYLAAQFAARVTAFDRDGAAVEFARRHWPAENIEWLTGDALDEGFLAGRSFDAALAMDTVEYLGHEQGKKHVAWLAARLKPGGLLVGTSGFPKTREEAERVAATDFHQPWIYTEDEFLALLRRQFSRATIIGGWMFLAIR